MKSRIFPIAAGTILGTAILSSAPAFAADDSIGGVRDSISTTSSVAETTTKSGPAAKGSLSALNVNVTTDVDGNRYIWITARAFNYASNEVARAWVEDPNGVRLDPQEATLFVGAEGFLDFGQQRFAVPLSGGLYTVHVSVGAGEAKTESSALKQVSQKQAPSHSIKDKVRVEFPNTEMPSSSVYVWVRGTSTGYQTNANIWATAWIEDSQGHHVTKHYDSTVYINADGSFEHGRLWFEMPLDNSGEYTIHSVIGSGSMRTESVVPLSIPRF